MQLEEYQSNRLRVYFGMSFAPKDASPADKRKADLEERKFKYNVEQALISVGSGGLTGKGWCQGTQNALGYLPKTVAHNDFIFSVIAEEWGFFGEHDNLDAQCHRDLSGIENRLPCQGSYGDGDCYRYCHALVQPRFYQHWHEHQTNARHRAAPAVIE